MALHNNNIYEKKMTIYGTISRRAKLEKTRLINQGIASACDSCHALRRDDVAKRRDIQ